MRTAGSMFAAAGAGGLLLLAAACARQAPADDAAARAGMIRTLRAGYGFTDARVLAAMARVPRQAFIPEAYRRRCDPYGDHPCPIGHGQTISQPFIVAYMTEKIAPAPGEKILEIGTGSGYQAALLADLGAEVYTIEIVPELADHARAALAAQGYGRVRVRTGDGYRGWPEHAPFDAILVTCAPDRVPPALVEQLRDGGRMILPLGAAGRQRLAILRKAGGRVEIREDLPVRFVPMIER